MTRVQFLVGAVLGRFLFATASRPALGPTQPPIQWVSAALIPEVKLLLCEADHWPPYSSEVKNAWKLYLHFPIRFHGVVIS